MRKSMLFLSTLTFVLCGAMISNADDGRKGKHQFRAEKMFQKMDLDGNGEVARNEMMQHAESRFSQMDADNSGSVTKAEAKAHHDKKKKERKSCNK